MTNFEKLKRLNKRELAKFLVLKTNDGYASPFTVCKSLEDFKIDGSYDMLYEKPYEEDK